MEPNSPEPAPFAVKDCALIALATGRQAHNLKEFRDQLLRIHPGSIFYHFWGGLLNPRFEEREYNNDFASWCRHALRDAVLGERLAVIDPVDFADLEQLRQELVEVIEERLDEREMLIWVQPDQPFEFIRSQIVVFDTHVVFHSPEALASHIPALSIGSVFYHFIDARRRVEGRVDDFSVWLGAFGGVYQPLSQALAAIDPYFMTLTELRAELAAAFERCLCEVPCEQSA